MPYNTNDIWRYDKTTNTVSPIANIFPDPTPIVNADWLDWTTSPGFILFEIRTTEPQGKYIVLYNRTTQSTTDITALVPAGFSPAYTPVGDQFVFRNSSPGTAPTSLRLFNPVNSTFSTAVSGFNKILATAEPSANDLVFVGVKESDPPQTPAIGGGATGGSTAAPSAPASTSSSFPLPANAQPNTEKATLPTATIPVLGIQPQTVVARVELPTRLNVKGVLFSEAVVGTNQRDNVTGSSSGEVIAGGKEKDNLTGGGGPDAFFFSTPGEFGKNLADIVTDFNRREGDKITITQEAFPGASAVKLATVSGTRAAKQSASSNSSFIYDNKKGFVYFNENRRQDSFGSGGVFAVLQGIPVISAGDFALI